jgi:uncharacterized membrane protein
VIRYTLAAALRITLLTPLFVISFIGGVAEEVVTWLDKVLPWMYKETKEERRVRLL